MKKVIQVVGTIVFIVFVVFMFTRSINNNTASPAPKDQAVDEFLIRANSQYRLNAFKTSFDQGSNASTLESDKLPGCSVQVFFEKDGKSVNGVTISYDKSQNNQDDHYKCIEYGMGLGVNSAVLKNQTLVAQVYKKITDAKWHYNDIYEGYAITVDDYLVSVRRSR